MREEEISKLYNGLTNVDDQFIQEAQTKAAKKDSRPKWAVMAACLCLVAAAAAAFPSAIPKPQEDGSEGGGAPVTSGPDQGISEMTPILLAQQETVDEIKNDMIDQDIGSWTEIPDSTLNFAYVVPVYSTANAVENSHSILETLLFDGQYKIPAVSNRACIGTFTVVRHEGKWVIGTYEKGFDLEAEMKKNDNRAACFISVPQLHEYGFLIMTDTGEKFAPIPTITPPDAISGEQLLEEIKKTAHTPNHTDG